MCGLYPLELRLLQVIDVSIDYSANQGYGCKCTHYRPGLLTSFNNDPFCSHFPTQSLVLTGSINPPDMSFSSNVTNVH